MRLGTKSVLFGYHQFLLHPLMVWLGWIKLYGWTWDPRVVVSFFLHDIGYIGRPDMDGPQGKSHPFLGAQIAHILFDLEPDGARWYRFNLYHSRDLVKLYCGKASKLCWADKMSFVLYPSWLLRALYFLSGEDQEYRMHSYDANGWAIRLDKMLGFDEWLVQARASNVRALQREGLIP